MTSFWKNLFHSDNASLVHHSTAKPNWSWNNESWTGPIFDLVLMQIPDVCNITHLFSISCKRVLTASKNGLLCVWDIEQNNCSQTILPHAHQSSITCVNLISEYPHHTAQQCITAALDRKIIVWSLIQLTVLTEIRINGSHIVRSLLYLASCNLFLAGSDVLQLWSMKGKLCSSIGDQFEGEDVRFLLHIGDNKIVCAYDKYLSVYRVVDSSIERGFELQHVTKLPHHNEIVKVLIEASESSFITASLDGAIILWTSFRLNFTKCFNMRQIYVDSGQRFSYSVQDVTVIDQSFIMAAIGNGFSIFDMNSGLTLAEIEEAHETKVTCVRYLRWLDLIATCAFDGRIRLWGYAKKTNFNSSEAIRLAQNRSSTTLTVGKVFLRAPLSIVLELCRKDNKRNKDRNYQIVCYHELLGHEDQVIDLLNMDVKGFLTYGRENCLFYWRNRDHFENELLNVIQSVF